MKAIGEVDKKVSSLSLFFFLWMRNIISSRFEILRALVLSIVSYFYFLQNKKPQKD